MKLAWLFINLLAYIISTETHALKRARRNSACPPYPCLPGQTSMSPCPRACCTTEAITPEVMIPCSVAPTANPIVQRPCGKLQFQPGFVSWKLSRIFASASFRCLDVYV